MLLQISTIILIVQIQHACSAIRNEVVVTSQLSQEDSNISIRQGKLLFQTNSDTAPVSNGAPTLYSIFENNPSNENVPLNNATPLGPLPDSDNNNFGGIPRSLFPTEADPDQRQDQGNSLNQPQGPNRHLWLSASAWVIITWALLAFALISMIILMTILYKKRIIQGRRGQGGQVVPNQFIVHVQGSNQPEQTNRNPELAGVELDGEEVYTYNQEKTEQAIQAQKSNKNLIAKVDIKPLKPNKNEPSSDSQSRKDLPNIPENSEASFSNNGQSNQPPQEGYSGSSKREEESCHKENTQTSNNQQDIPNELQSLTQLEGLDMRHQCLICFEDYKNEEQVKKLKCQHTFHKECVSQWFINSNTCPFCRVDRYSSSQ